MRRRMRGIGQTYSTTSTPAGDFQIVTDVSGNQTIFDPNGNIVSSMPTSYAPFYGPVQPGGSAYVPVYGSSTASSIASSVASLLAPSTPATSSTPSWLLPVGIVALALFIGIGMSSK